MFFGFAGASGDYDEDGIGNGKYGSDDADVKPGYVLAQEDECSNIKWHKSQAYEYDFDDVGFGFAHIGPLLHAKVAETAHERFHLFGSDLL